MRHLRTFARFWWDFVVGDDWRIAAGVAAGLGLCALLVHESVDVWWLLPLAVLALLTESLRRAIGHETRQARGTLHRRGR